MKARGPNNQTEDKGPAGKGDTQSTFEDNFKRPMKLSRELSEAIIAALK
jgi:hypothetical protein